MRGSTFGKYAHVMKIVLAVLSMNMIKQKSTWTVIMRKNNARSGKTPRKYSWEIQTGACCVCYETFPLFQNKVCDFSLDPPAQPRSEGALLILPLHPCR